MFFFFPFVTLHVLCITIKVWQYMFYVQPNYYSPQLISVALLPFTSTQTSLSLCRMEVPSTLVAYLATKTKFLPSTRRLHPLFIPAALHSSPTTKRQNSWSDPNSSQRAKTVTGRMRIKSSQNVHLHTDSRPIESPDSTRRRHFWAPQHASSKQGALWKTARKKGSQVARRGRQGLNSEYNQRRHSGQTWKWSR